MASDRTTVTVLPAGEILVDVRFGVGSGSGTVIGPVTSTDEAIARFNGTNGVNIQNSVVTITDAGVVAGAVLSGASNTITNVSLTTGVTGTLPVANGGTGATTAAGARTNLGLVIGTDVLAPNGSGVNLTALNATQLTSGTVPDARFPATLPVISGVNLTAVAKLTANTFTAAQTISDTTASTSSVTGALIVSGGVGISKDIWVNDIRFGRGAGDVSTNNAIGQNALAACTTGANNVAIGFTAMDTLTTAARNTAVGSGALSDMSTGAGPSQNCAFGYTALAGVTSGSDNVGVGFTAGLSITTGTSNVVIGASADIGAGNTNAIAIGASAVGDGSNTTVIGNTSTTAARIEGTVTMPDGIRVPAVECQNVIATSATSDSSTTVIPFDDTIPQQGTEGELYLSVTITPTSATSTLIIEFDAFVSHASAGGTCVLALFQDATAGALTAAASTMAGTSYAEPGRLRYSMAAGTTSATTFKIHYGPGAAGTAYMMRHAAELFSTANLAVLSVREIRP